MSMTKEKIEVLANYMSENEERAEVLMALSAEEACAKINADGYQFTPEDLADFAAEVEAMYSRQEAELDEDALDAVAGGALNSKIRIYMRKYYIVGPGGQCRFNWKNIFKKVM